MHIGSLHEPGGGHFLAYSMKCDDQGTIQVHSIINAHSMFLTVHPISQLHIVLSTYPKSSFPYF